MRHSNQSNPHSSPLIASETITHAILQHPQEKRLEIKRHLANLIQAENTSICCLDFPGMPLFLCSGKGTFGVAEDLAPNQISRHAATIDRYKWTTCRLARSVNSAGKELLSNTSLAFNKYRSTSRRHLAGAFSGLLHYHTFSKDFFELQQPLCHYPRRAGDRSPSSFL